MRPDLEELGNVEDDRKEDDEALVELDVLLWQDGGVPQLTVEADPNVALETETGTLNSVDYRALVDL